MKKTTDMTSRWLAFDIVFTSTFILQQKWKLNYFHCILYNEGLKGRFGVSRFELNIDFVFNLVSDALVSIYFLCEEK